MDRITERAISEGIDKSDVGNLLTKVSLGRFKLTNQRLSKA